MPMLIAGFLLFCAQVSLAERGYDIQVAETNNPEAHCEKIPPSKCVGKMPAEDMIRELVAEGMTEEFAVEEMEGFTCMEGFKCDDGSRLPGNSLEATCGKFDMSGVEICMPEPLPSSVKVHTGDATLNRASSTVSDPASTTVKDSVDPLEHSTVRSTVGGSGDSLDSLDHSTVRSTVGDQGSSTRAGSTISGLEAGPLPEEFLSACDVRDEKDPKEVLGKLRDCTAALNEFAKLTKEGQVKSREANLAYVTTFNKVMLDLLSLKDLEAFTQAFSKDQSEALLVLTAEADKAKEEIAKLVKTT